MNLIVCDLPSFPFLFTVNEILDTAKLGKWEQTFSHGKRRVAL